MIFHYTEYSIWGIIYGSCYQTRGSGSQLISKLLHIFTLQQPEALHLSSLRKAQPDPGATLVAGAAGGFPARLDLLIEDVIRAAAQVCPTSRLLGLVLHEEWESLEWWVEEWQDMLKVVRSLGQMEDMFGFFFEQTNVSGR